MNNPLRQYFRRPALYVTLPSRGKFYPEGALETTESGELAVYPMTAIDEITSKTPDALFNGIAISEIIKSCVPAIKDPWKMPSIDLDAVLIAIRAATNGTDLEIDSTCPSCEVESKYGINLIGLLSQMKAGEYDNLLAIGDLKFKFKPLDYTHVNQGNLVQFEMQRDISMLQSMEEGKEKNDKSSEAMIRISKINIKMLADTIEYVLLPTGEQISETEFLVEYLEHCDRNTHEFIRKHVGELREGTTIKPQKIKCINCQHEYDQPLILNVTDFFD
jgi:rubredoxin